MLLTESFMMVYLDYVLSDHCVYFPLVVLIMLFLLLSKNNDSRATCFVIVTCKNADA